MNSKKILTLAILASLNLTACGENQEDTAKAPVVEVHNGYNATLAEGIQFSEKPDYPAFIKSVAGMSGFESIGRWTEGKEVNFVFTQNLPTKFTLDLEFAPAFGPDVGKVVHIQAGDWKNQFVASKQPQKVTFIIKTTTPTDSIKFIIPEPISPIDLGTGTDTREVGIMFKRLSITSDEIAKVVPTAIPSVPVIAPAIAPVPTPEPAPVVKIAPEKPVDIKTAPAKKAPKHKKPAKTAETSSLAK